MMPSSKALGKVKDAIREMTCRKSAYESLDSKIQRLNPLIKGWRNYFEHGNSNKRFIQLDEYVWTNSKDVHRKVESEGSCKQISGSTNKNRIQG